MKVENKTRWDTRDLRKFFLAGLKALGASKDKTIIVKYNRSTRARGEEYVSGHAYYPSWYNREGDEIQLNIPREEFDLFSLAQVFEHEIGHTLGVRHKDMLPVDELTPTWHEGLILRKKESKSQLSKEEKRAETARKREQHVREKVREYEEKLDGLEKTRKRWKKRLAEWKKKAAYYERKAASNK